jgi:hypothetical protein
MLSRLKNQIYTYTDIKLCKTCDKVYASQIILLTHCIGIDSTNWDRSIL